MEDGPYSELVKDTAEPTGKVVRLPRDWLGPYEELIPFGSRTMPPEAEPGDSDPAGPPPSAEDFWGERSAAIHSVVQAPAAGDTEVAEPQAARPRFGLARRHLAAASALAAAATATAIVLLSGGAVHQIAGGARLNLAAVLSSSISRNFRIGPPRIVPATQPSRPRAGRGGHRSHRATVTELASHAIRHQSGSPASERTYPIRASSASAPPTYRSDLGQSSLHAGTGPPRSSGESVSPTGESGALGPVRSPNG